MGYVLDFLGGMGEAAKELGLRAVKEKAAAERDEANFIKQRNLDEINNQRADQRSGREHGWRMDEAGFEAKKTSEEKAADREFEAEQKGMDRQSAERIASMRSSKSPSVRTVTDPETGETTTLQWDAEAETWNPITVGNDSAGGGKVDMQTALQMARSEAEDKAGLLRSDQEDFGGSKEEWINRRALEISSGTASAPAPSKAAPSGKPEAVNGGDSMRKVATQAEYDALPAGSEFIDAEDGKKYRKPDSAKPKTGIIGKSMPDTATSDPKPAAPRGKMSAAAGSEFKGSLINTRAGKMYKPPQSNKAPISLAEARRLGYIDDQGNILK